MVKIEVMRQDLEDISILHLKGELDTHTAPEFENALKTLIREKRFNIIVALEELQYISSAGLNVFMEFIEDVRRSKGDIKITNASPRVFKAFEWVGYPLLYEFCSTWKEALEKFKHR